jgi:hypothetical protein
MASLYRGRGTGEPVSLVELDAQMDEPYHARWIPSAFGTDADIESVVANGHWRFGIDEFYEPFASVFCWKATVTLSQLVDALGEAIVSPRTQRQVHPILGWNDQEVATGTVDAVYVIRNTDVHLFIGYTKEPIVPRRQTAGNRVPERKYTFTLRESYALDADDPFFEMHQERKAYRISAEEEENLDRAHGTEKRALYDRVLAEGMDEYSAIEAAEKYDPEYDDDSAYGTDPSAESDGDMSVDYAEEEYERDADGKVIIMDVETSE